MSEWNVNNWHWEEVNHSDWALERIREIYKDFKYAKDGIELTTHVDTVSGTAFMNVRKGKKIYGYDLKLTLKFRASDNETLDTAEGEIVFEDLDDYTALEDVKISYKFKKDANADLVEKIKKTFPPKTYIGNFETFLEEFRTK